MTDETTADAGTGTGPSGSLASEAGGDAPELSGVSVGPLRAGERVTLTDQKGRRHSVLLRAGGVFHTTHGGVAKVAEQIKKFGADHFFIGTDFGVYTLPTPVEGFREFIACLMDLGLTDEEIRKVSSINPGKLVDLND